MKLLNTRKKRRLAVLTAAMVLLCIAAGLAAVRFLFLKNETSEYKDAAARIETLFTGGKITDEKELTPADGSLTEYLSDIIFGKKTDGDIDVKNAYKLIAMLCARMDAGSVHLPARLFEGRDAVTGAGLYEFMHANMTEESAQAFAKSVTALYAMDEKMYPLWLTAAADTVPEFDSGKEDFTLPVYILKEPSQSEPEKDDPYRILYMNCAGYLDRYKNEPFGLTGCDGSSLYYRGAKAGQIGSALYPEFGYDLYGTEIFDLIFGGTHTKTDMLSGPGGGFGVHAAKNEAGGLDVLYGVSPGILVPVSWLSGFKDAAEASRLLFFNAVPKIKTPEPAEDGFDLSAYATGYSEDRGPVTDAYIIELICNYSQYGGSDDAVTNSIVLPKLTEKSAAADAINARITSDFLSSYGMYLPYLAAGDTDHSPVGIITDYSYASGNETEVIVVMTHRYDFVMRESAAEFRCYYFKEDGKTGATIEDYLRSRREDGGGEPFIIGGDTAAVAVQLNSKQVRLANSGNRTGELDGYSVKPEDIKGIFRNNNTGSFRVVTEVGEVQYVFELPAGSDHGRDIYYMYDNRKSLRGDNITAAVLVRDESRFEIACDGMPPLLVWLSEDKIAFTEKLSATSCRIATALPAENKITDEYILTSDSVAAISGIDPAEYFPAAFDFLSLTASADGNALTGRYYLHFEKREPEGAPNEDGIPETYRVYTEIREGYVRADLISGELTFIDAQPTEIPAEFKEIVIIPKEIVENGFAPEPEVTETDGAAVTLTLPAVWDTDNGFLFYDSTRTEEGGYLHNKRFEGCNQLIRTGPDFIWDSDVNLRASEQSGDEFANSFGYGKGRVFVTANGYTAVEYPGVYYIKVSDEFALFIRTYIYEEDTDGYAGIFGKIIDSLSFAAGN